jgi:hypothetical protein
MMKKEKRHRKKERETIVSAGCNSNNARQETAKYSGR